VTLRAAVGGRDFAHVLFDAGGGVGHLYVDGAAPVKHRAIVVTTSRWTYDGDLLAPRLTRAARGGLSGDRPRNASQDRPRSTSPGRTGAQPIDIPLPLEEPLLAQARALADALDGAAPREIATGADGALAVKLAEHAATACASGAENLSLFARP
jgi:hypothetical protein